MTRLAHLMLLPIRWLCFALGYVWGECRNAFLWGMAASRETWGYGP